MTIEEKIPWVEKYRPRSIDQISSQEEVLPHLLFYGPPGTGKTSTVLALARDLYGPSLYRSRILELNASDERGIAVVRGRVKQFAQTTCQERAWEAGPDGKPLYPCPPFKLVLLDEADALTADAQTALRRLIETYAGTTRFCLVCNYVSRIIGPLASRCAKFRFGPVPQGPALAKLREICQAEGVNVETDDGGMNSPLVRILAVAQGDLRRAITLLQSVHLLAGDRHLPITTALIDRVSGGLPDPQAIDNLYQTAFHNNNQKGHDTILSLINREIVRKGVSAGLVLAHLQSLHLADPLLSSTYKARAALALANTDYALHEGADEQLQLESLLLSLSTFNSQSVIQL